MLANVYSKNGITVRQYGELRDGEYSTAVCEADVPAGFGVWLKGIIGFNPFKPYATIAPDVRIADVKAHSELQVAEDTMQQRKLFESCYQARALHSSGFDAVE
jgi:hypothetical protein